MHLMSVNCDCLAENNLCAELGVIFKYLLDYKAFDDSTVKNILPSNNDRFKYKPNRNKNNKLNEVSNWCSCNSCVVSCILDKLYR